MAPFHVDAAGHNGRSLAIAGSDTDCQVFNPVVTGTISF